MADVFISHVHEDIEAVRRLAADLRRCGIQVWLARERLRPGRRWKADIRTAIEAGDYFLACFSSNYLRREKNYMNAELGLAIEQLRQYSHDRTWFIPVLLSQCTIPDRSIGPGETLRDLHPVDLTEDWDDGIRSIATEILGHRPREAVETARNTPRDAYFRFAKTLSQHRSSNNTWAQAWRASLVREPRHSELIDKWVKKMAGDPANRCILHELFRRDSSGNNLSRDLATEFLDHLGDLLASGQADNARDIAQLIGHVTDSNPGTFYVRGKRRPKTPVQLSMFIGLQDFTRFCHFPEFIGPRLMEVKAAIDRGVVSAKNLVIPSEWKRPWWVVATEDVEGLSGNEIRDALGLINYSRGALVEIRYPKGFLPAEIAAPTVLDARGFPWFGSLIPLCHWLDHGWGRTATLSSLHPGAREAVHFPLQRFDASFGVRATEFISRPAMQPTWDDRLAMLEIMSAVETFYGEYMVTRDPGEPRLDYSTLIQRLDRGLGTHATPRPRE